MDIYTGSCRGSVHACVPVPEPVCVKVCIDCFLYIEMFTPFGGGKIIRLRKSIKPTRLRKLNNL